MSRAGSVCTVVLGLTTSLPIHGLQDPSQTSSRNAPADDRRASASTRFESKELAKIFQHSPLPRPPPDPTNAHAEDPNAAQLGQWLFFDKRISKNGELACVSCHDPSRAFADGRALAQGLGTTDRNAPALWNAAWQRWYFWDGRADSLWAQALQPIENEVELGGNRLAIAHLFQRDEKLCEAYRATFGALPDMTDAEHFPHAARPVPGHADDPLERTWSSMQEMDRDAVNRVFANAGKALEAYVRKIESRNSAFDRFVAALRTEDLAEQANYPEAARRGLALFIGKANCRSCHAGANFTDNEFHNVGVPSIGVGAPSRGSSESSSRTDSSSSGAYVAPGDSESLRRSHDVTAPSPGTGPRVGDPSSAIVDAGRRAGLERARKDPFNAAGAYSDEPEGARANELAALVQSGESFGQFKTPSLRNVALTAPYMHQGQFATLADVLHYYSTLDRAVPAGHHGEQVIRPLHLTAQEIEDLIAFLSTLTDADLPRELTSAPSSPLRRSQSANPR